jgi:hypothetical protein
MEMERANAKILLRILSWISKVFRKMSSLSRGNSQE